MKRANLLLMLLGLAAIFIASPILAFAQTPATITINPNIPGMYNVSTAGPCGWIVDFYNFALIIAGILAFGAIVYGGVLSATSAGNASKLSEGRSWIWSALIGLLLLGGAYIILYTVNPNLVKCSVPTLSGVAVTPTPSVPPVVTPPTPGQCPLTPLAPITDPQALAMEDGEKILWSAGTSTDADITGINTNLNALKDAYDTLKSLLTGDTVSVSSVYRPLAYQTHLYDIYNHAKKYNSNPNYYESIPACTSIKLALHNEENLHHVCQTSAQCNVGYPGSCPPDASSHVLGYGIDLAISGSLKLNYYEINTLLKKHNVGIQWQRLPRDPVHFQLTNPPYTGCAPSQ